MRRGRGSYSATSMAGVAQPSQAPRQKPPALLLPDPPSPTLPWAPPPSPTVHASWSSRGSFRNVSPTLTSSKAACCPQYSPGPAVWPQGPSGDQVLLGRPGLLPLFLPPRGLDSPSPLLQPGAPELSSLTLCGTGTLVGLSSFSSSLGLPAYPPPPRPEAPGKWRGLEAQPPSRIFCC